MVYRFFTILSLICFLPTLFIAQTPEVLGITASHDVVDQALVGSATFSITVAYSHPMDVAVLPDISFPEAGKDPVALGGLVLATSGWVDAYTFRLHYDVVDLNQTISRIPVQVSGGADLSGNVPADRTETDLFCLSTQLDVPKIINMQTDHRYNTIYIEFDISTNFGVLFGTWTHSDSLLYLQFPELGDLSAYFDFEYLWITRYILKVTVIKKQAAEFRDIRAYFEWPIARRDNANACRLKHYWNGKDFDLDFVAPYVTELKTNLSVIREADAGTGTFQIQVRYNENVAGDVEFSFPTLGEDPSNTLTLLSKVKTNGDSVITATYNVLNVHEFIPDIDVQVSGALNSPVFNSNWEPQEDTLFANVFSINTCAASQAPQMLKSPDEAVACPGSMLSISLAVPGSGGGAACTDEYRYSTDGGQTWSAWSEALPVFSAVPGTNLVMGRQSCSGNCISATSTVSWTVEDETFPTIFCPADVTRATDANQCTAIVAYAAPAFSDNCAGATLVRTDGPVSGSVFAKGTTMVHWKVTDIAGNSSVCGFTVTVTDGQSPSITCPANQVRTMDANQCSATVTYATPTFSDNCTGVWAALHSGPASGSSFPSGKTNVVWKASDGAGLTSTCSFSVTVNDAQSPTLSCPANQSKTTDPTACTAMVTYTTPTFTDNCAGGSVSLQSGLASGQSFPKGMTTVVWKATDAAGLTKTCTFRVTVNDTENPLIACPSSQSANTGAGTCTALVTYPTPTATDNCGSLTVVRISGPASGSSFPSGTTNVTWRAIDGSGRSSTCSFAVTVSDAAPPAINCPQSILVTGSGSPCMAAATYTTPTVTDNCGVQSVFMLSGLTSGSSFPAGTTNVVWRAVDVNGNSATCAFSVTVGCGTGSQEFEDRSSRFEEADLSISDFRLQTLDFKLSPNPATTQVQIWTENLGETDGELTILDAQGRLVWQSNVPCPLSNVQHPMSNIALDNFAAGVYFVTLRTGRETLTKRLIKTE